MTPVVVLGSETCEDTAITRSRLEALGIAHDYRDIDADAASADLVARLNNGNRVTPTVVFGAEAAVVAEPSLERLGELLRDAGYPVEPPEATQYHGDVTTRAIPLRSLDGVDGRPVSIDRFRSRSQVALFLAHDPGCRACFGYARQLAARRTALGDADAVPIVVASGPPEAAADWREGIPEEVAVAGDPGGAWKRAIARELDFPADEAALLLLDRFLAPRAISVAPEAGGLVDPSGAVEWLRFFALDCPECSGEIDWPT